MTVAYSPCSGALMNVRSVLVVATRKGMRMAIRKIRARPSRLSVVSLGQGPHGPRDRKTVKGSHITFQKLEYTVGI